MVKEFDKKKMPTVHVVNMVPVSQDIGANRIVRGVSIPHPLGDPSKSPEESYEIRKELVRKALNALTDDIKEQTVYE